MKNLRYAMLLPAALAPAVTATLLSSDQVTWLASKLSFVPGYEFFHQLGTRQALNQLVSTAVALACAIALLGLCLAFRDWRATLVSGRSGGRGRLRLNATRPRLVAVALMLVALVVFSWMSPQVMLHDSSHTVSAAVTRFLGGSALGQGIYFCILSYFTVWSLLLARLILLPGVAARELPVEPVEAQVPAFRPMR